MLELKNISLYYHNFHLEDVSFTVEEGDYFILLGNSGSGKSILLELLAGLVIPGQGSIMLNGIPIEHTKPQKREIGLVFQDYALFPHLTVEANIGFALKGIGMASAERNLRVEAIADKLHIANLLKRMPSTLSGGELQRVALARTLIHKPKVLLLDEPLSSIDSKLRNEIRSILRQLNREGQTIVHVTHDFDEALSLARRIAIINEGRIIQTGTPEEVFGSPRSEFVAHFVGIRNFFRVKITQIEEGCKVLIAPGIEVVTLVKVNSAQGYLMVRAEDITLSNENYVSSAMNNFEGILVEKARSFTGVDVVVDIGVKMHISISRESYNRLNLNEGRKVWLHFKASSLRIIESA